VASAGRRGISAHASLADGGRVDRAVRGPAQTRRARRIARELHDTLLQSFQALALRFQAVLNVLPDRPAEAEARLTAALSSR
jgi:signal transduction histidine kinase